MDEARGPPRGPQTGGQSLTGSSFSKLTRLVTRQSAKITDKIAKAASNDALHGAAVSATALQQRGFPYSSSTSFDASEYPSSFDESLQRMPPHLLPPPPPPIPPPPPLPAELLSATRAGAHLTEAISRGNFGGAHKAPFPPSAKTEDAPLYPSLPTDLPGSYASLQQPCVTAAAAAIRQTVEDSSTPAAAAPAAAAPYDPSAPYDPYDAWQTQLQGRSQQQECRQSFCLKNPLDAPPQRARPLTDAPPRSIESRSLMEHQQQQEKHHQHHQQQQHQQHQQQQHEVRQREDVEDQKNRLTGGFKTYTARTGAAMEAHGEHVPEEEDLVGNEHLQQTPLEHQASLLGAMGAALGRVVDRFIKPLDGKRPLGAPWRDASSEVSSEESRSHSEEEEEAASAGYSEAGGASSPMSRQRPSHRGKTRHCKEKEPSEEEEPRSGAAVVLSNLGETARALLQVAAAAPVAAAAAAAAAVEAAAAAGEGSEGEDDALYLRNAEATAAKRQAAAASAEVALNKSGEAVEEEGSPDASGNGLSVASASGSSPLAEGGNPLALRHRQEELFKEWRPFGCLWREMLKEDCCVEPVQSLQALYDAFATSTPEEGMKRSEFLNLFKAFPRCLPQREHQDFLFDAIDRKQNGTLPFKDFRWGIYCCGPSVQQDLTKARGRLRLQLLYRAYDVDNDGLLNREELQCLLCHLHAVSTHPADRALSEEQAKARAAVRR
ncbi:uncharacterized protein LOC34623160 [Cyclospora cayetanensis]|uniref:Uncharacterized protein LOC34623160 n=1 Tax=Cyclospora cayetanensis TaxID=88456 RepID=A0A6P6S246_9EIME|nr:uncharacterized protein LOC34623160 [Cyclospora cayetanensis]